MHGQAGKFPSSLRIVARLAHRARLLSRFVGNLWRLALKSRFLWIVLTPGTLHGLRPTCQRLPSSLSRAGACVSLPRSLLGRAPGAPGT